MLHRRDLMRFLGLFSVLSFMPKAIGKVTHMTKKPLPQGPRAWPQIIAHRGASGYLPEHSLAAYRLAAEMGADYIEPDLVFTKDGQLIVRHDHYLSTTTDVADHPEFADRRTTKPGHDKPDWFSEDFTLAEIKTLRCRQAFPGRTKAMDGRFEIATFAEVLDLRESLSRELGREIGIYPETKVPGYFASLGHDYLPALITHLKARRFEEASAPIVIQSFEPEILQRLRPLTKVRLVHLFDDKAVLSPEVLERVADYADGIGPHKGLLVKKDGRSSGVIEAAHDLGLVVHPWTFRNDQLPDAFKGPRAEYEFFFDLGVDAVFTDFTDTAHSVRLIRRAYGRK